MHAFEVAELVITVAYIGSQVAGGVQQVALFIIGVADGISALVLFGDLPRLFVPDKQQRVLFVARFNEQAVFVVGVVTGCEPFSNSV